MIFVLFLNLLERLGLIIIFGFFISKTVIFQKYVVEKRSSWVQNLLFACVWGGLGIVMTLLGTPVGGGIANSRTIPVVLAGIFGGPWVGAFAGMIAGVHRAFLTHGGELTALSCGVSTFLGGLIGGLAKRRLDRAKSRWLQGLILSLGVEVLQMGIILLMARPFDQALQLVQLIFLPMTFLNALGIGLFLLMVQQIYDEHEKAAARKAQMSFELANLTLPFFKEGLTEEAAELACGHIYEITGYDAVSITNASHVLAHIGAGSDHHEAGGPIWTGITKVCLETGRVQMADKEKEIGCSHQKCRLKAVVVAPLGMNDRTVGTLKVYRIVEHSITQSDVELVKGLATLFTTQLELSSVEQQKVLREVAELKALRAQIKPHFLFNSLNTIMSLVRTDAEEARKLLQELSVILRSGYKDSGPMVPLREEIRTIEAFLRIEKARFPEKLEVSLDIDPDLAILVPPLILQPLVENAVKHGIRQKAGRGQVHLSIKDQGDGVSFVVSDNGVGMDRDRLSKLEDAEGIGLSNVRSRLQTLYDVDLTIDSQPDQGTSISFTIPKEEV